MSAQTLDVSSRRRNGTSPSRKGWVAKCQRAIGQATREYAPPLPPPPRLDDGFLIQYRRNVIISLQYDALYTYDEAMGLFMGMRFRVFQEPVSG